MQTNSEGKRREAVSLNEQQAMGKQRKGGPTKVASSHSCEGCAPAVPVHQVQKYTELFCAAAVPLSDMCPSLPVWQAPLHPSKPRSETLVHPHLIPQYVIHLFSRPPPTWIMNRRGFVFICISNLAQCLARHGPPATLIHLKQIVRLSPEGE